MPRKVAIDNSTGIQLWLVTISDRHQTVALIPLSMKKVAVLNAEMCEEQISIFRSTDEAMGLIEHMKEHGFTHVENPQEWRPRKGRRTPND